MAVRQQHYLAHSIFPILSPFGPTEPPPQLSNWSQLSRSIIMESENVYIWEEDRRRGEARAPTRPKICMIQAGDVVSFLSLTKLLYGGQ